MGDWLIGVYKGRMITATKQEKKSIWAHSEDIRKSMFWYLVPTRKKLIPYFYVLESIPDKDTTILPWGKSHDEKIIERYGLNSRAFKFASDFGPIPACGFVEKDYFVLDEGYCGQNYLRALEKNFSDPNKRICVLALNTKNGIVRTGTFFKFFIKGSHIAFTPCAHNGNYLVGKGVLLGISEDSHFGTMNEGDAESEMKCAVSRLCVNFKNRAYSDLAFYTVYRQVSTDLRADMPLALLKISQIDHAFENMFEGLGVSFKNGFGHSLDFMVGRNVLLDGNIVDFADIHFGVDVSDGGNEAYLFFLQLELCTLISVAAILSVKNKTAALSAFANGKKSVLAFASKNIDKITETYLRLVKWFAIGAGTNVVPHLKCLRGLDGLKLFLSFELPPEWKQFFEKEYR